jgi:hypothetical protein
MLQAKRAAELDAYRKLAEQIDGAALSRNTGVADLALSSDRIANHLAAVLKGAKATSVLFREDGSCEVTMRLKLRELVETVTRTTERYTHNGQVNEKEQRNTKAETVDRILEATGTGMAPPRAEAQPVPERLGAVENGDPFEKEVEVIRRVIGRVTDSPDAPAPAPAGDMQLDEPVLPRLEGQR